jgi:hypothetical protein
MARYTLTYKPLERAQPYFDLTTVDTDTSTILIHLNHPAVHHPKLRRLLPTSDISSVRPPPRKGFADEAIPADLSYLPV